MLSREQAETKLKAFSIPNWIKVRSDELDAAPAVVRTTGRALLGRDADGKAFRSWEKQYKARHQAAEDLAEMSPAQRHRLFGILFPRLAETIEAGWQLHRTLPYETSTDRKAFRTPSDDSAKAQSRTAWFQSLVSALEGFDPDIAWIATWAAYINHGYSGDELGILLAAAIDAGREVGQQVQTILEESASGQHDIGGMGSHVTRALLVCSKPEAWAFVERLLLAAQRQEGLRQVIFESVDEAHPGAFKRMLRLILDRNLLRFAATVRAVDVWFGLQWTILTPAILKRTVEQALLMLDDSTARTEVLASDTTEALYLALYAIAMEDAHAAIAPAAKLLSDPVIERRFIGARFLRDLDLPAARARLVAGLDDADLRIVMQAIEDLPTIAEGPDLWDLLVALLGRMPAKRQEGAALVWPWATTSIDRSAVAGQLVHRLGNRPATVLVPFLADLNSYQRGEVVEQLAKIKKWDTATRDTLFALVGDRDGWVREKALKALKKCAISVEDAQRIEEVLVRKNGDMRRGALTLLVKQKPPLALESADRLLGSKKAPQRIAGLELLRLLVEKKRLVTECRERATTYKQKYDRPTEEEELQLDIILDVERVKPKLDDSFGLSDPAKRSQPIEPKARKVTLCTPAVVAMLQDLDALIHKNRETPITIESYSGPEEVLLGNVHWQFPSPRQGEPIEREMTRLPLREVWEQWYDNRPKKMRDADGLEWIRASVWQGIDKAQWTRLRKQYGKEWKTWLDLMANGQSPIKLKYPQVVRDLVAWMLRLHPPEGGMDFACDVVETAFAHVPDEVRKRVVDVNDWRKRDRDWRVSSPLDSWVGMLQAVRLNDPEAETAAHRLRQWQLMHWRDEPAPGVSRMRPELSLLVVGSNAGQTTAADLYDQILGPNDPGFAALRELTTPGRMQTYNGPTLAPVVERCVERILEIELSRGEMPTPASTAAHALQSLSGLSTLLRVLRPLDKKPLARQSYGESKTIILSHLVKITRPTAEDTPEVFAEQTKKAGITRDRLLQLAFAAPQWLDHIEHTLAWPGLKEAVWWFLAHMPGGRNGLDPYLDDNDYFDEFDVDDDDEAAPAAPQANPWERIISERTPLSAEDRAYGAVDAGWFHRAYEPLGRKRWDLQPDALAVLQLHYLRWVLFPIKGDTYFMYQGIFDTDFDKYTEDAVTLFGITGLRTVFENLEGFPTDWQSNPGAFVKFVRDHQCPSFLEYAEYPFVSATEIKKALKLKAAFSEMLDQMQ